MLEFSAQDYVEISHQLGLMLASVSKREPTGLGTGKAIEKLVTETNRLGLFVTREALGQFLVEISESNKPTLTKERGELTVHWQNILLDDTRWAHHIESIISTLKAELKSIAFRVIPSGKTLYCDPNWLTTSQIYTEFPSAWKEFQAAGRCYAYGENTACAFHLQRALEWGLKSLSVHLGKRFDRNSWGKHLEDIDKELTNRYKNAGQRTPEEKFYSETATQFGHMKVAWRNPTMHIEAKYDEGEAAYLLTTVEKFMTHLADNGLKEAQS